MRKLLTLIVWSASTVVLGQTNTFPATGSVGIGTLGPSAPLHIKTATGVSAWLGLDKPAGAEGGVQFMKESGTLFYLYSDNSDNDALKIQATGLSGENDALPRIHIPFSNKDLYFVQSGGNVGIGTTTPSTKLHVMGGGGYAVDLAVNGRMQTGDANNTGGIWLNNPGSLFVGQHAITKLGFFNGGAWRMVLDDVGNVGIGTTAPLTRLDVNGAIHISAAGLNSPPAGLGYGMFAHSGVGIGTYSVHGGISFWGGSSPIEYMRITNGNVGIGTTTPDSKLSVKGQIHAQEVKVDLNGAIAPDYVFEYDYKLPSLEEIKSYIEANKHLPEVPSAKEIEANGLKLGEMNLLLLKKVEELTLYILEQEKRIQKLEQKDDQK